jgi:NAD(P)-dependent dehydrogenase (short-subunit alcohol dehydrogenase family)
VTGSTSNIGRAIAIAFAAEGALAVITGRDENRGTAVVDAVRRSGGQAEFVAARLDGSAAVSRDLAERATAALGGHIDILLNNAGIFPGGATADTSEASFDEVYGVNVKAAFFLTAAIAGGVHDGWHARGTSWIA